MEPIQNEVIPLRAAPDTPTEDRQLVVVDLENLCGGSEAVTTSHGAARHQLRATLGTGLTTLTVVAYGRLVQATLPGLPFMWPEARVLVGSGIDGADRCLLDVLENEPVAQRSMRIVVGSGDGIFAEATRRLVASGHHVTVIARPGTISRRLAFAANEVVEMNLEQVRTSPQHAVAA